MSSIFSISTSIKQLLPEIFDSDLTFPHKNNHRCLSPKVKDMFDPEFVTSGFEITGGCCANVQQVF